MSTAWYVVRRIAHALGWLWILAIPAAVATDIVTGSFADSMPEAWLRPGILSKMSIVIMCVAVGAIIVCTLLLWIYAIRRRWSLKWPLIVAAVLFWPFGFLWVTMIGLGKLIIHAIGRNGDLASSDLRESTALDARPRGLVEYASYE